MNSHSFDFPPKKTRQPKADAKANHDPKDAEGLPSLHRWSRTPGNIFENIFFGIFLKNIFSNFLKNIFQNIFSRPLYWERLSIYFHGHYQHHLIARSDRGQIDTIGKTFVRYSLTPKPQNPKIQNPKIEKWLGPKTPKLKKGVVGIFID